MNDPICFHFRFSRGEVELMSDYKDRTETFGFPFSVEAGVVRVNLLVCNKHNYQLKRTIVAFTSPRRSRGEYSRKYRVFPVCRSGSSTEIYGEGKASNPTSPRNFPKTRT